MSLNVLFMGANGFPAKVYAPIGRLLGVEMGKREVDLNWRGLDYYGGLGGGTRNWQNMVDLTVKEASSIVDSSGPLTGLGHSAGGALICCAAAKEPELFSNIVIVDSPMFNPLKRFLFSLGYLLPSTIIDNVHPLIKAAKNKKNLWGTMEEAEEYVRSRRLFDTFDSKIVDSWLSEGLQVDSDTGKVSLVFSREAEAIMYKTTPTETPLIGFKNGNMSQYDAVHQQGHFLYSSRYKFLDKEDVKFLKERFKGLQFGEFDNEHFWPMIDPEGFVERVKDCV